MASPFPTKTRSQSHFQALLGHFANSFSQQLRRRNTVAFRKFHGRRRGNRQRRHGDRESGCIRRGCSRTSAPDRNRSRRSGFHPSVAQPARGRPQRFGVERNVARHFQVREHLLRDTLEHRRRNLSAFVGTDRRIELHEYRDGRRVERREAHERSDQIVRRVASCVRIIFLRGSRFSGRRIAVQPAPFCPCRSGSRSPSSGASKLPWFAESRVAAAVPAAR